MCRCGGVQSNHVAEQHVTSLANYVSNVRQADHVSYVSVPYMILPSDTQ